MKRKQLWKGLGAGALAFALTVSPIAGVTAQAAGETGDDAAATAEAKKGGSAKALDPTQDEAIPATGTEGQPDFVAGKPAYADTEIPVWGFTEDATVYSVDVEWGAMTFQWENSSWDPETHMKKDGAGWKVYDDTKGKALDATEDAINEIKVTNHSNAPVWATLKYASEADYAADTTGAFSYVDGIEADAADKDVLKAKLTAEDKDAGVPAYLSLETADNATTDDAAGTPTVGKAYFMPAGLATDKQTDNGITKWTKIGTITVGIKTVEPKAATTPDVTEP